MNEDYSKREIDEKWNDISKALTRIETQTTTTNGRVSKLELEKAERSGFNKAAAIFGAAAWAITLSFTGWIAFQVLQNKADIGRISAILSGYDVTIK